MIGTPEEAGLEMVATRSTTQASAEVAVPAAPQRRRRSDVQKSETATMANEPLQRVETQSNVAPATEAASESSETRARTRRDKTSAEKPAEETTLVQVQTRES